MIMSNSKIITDEIYGQFEITEPVLLELIASQPLQRLQGIAQHGLPVEFDQFKGFNRFEHSIGVMLILRKLGASLEEQIAGLIHDVSHLAFSHVVDWMKDRGSIEDYQDTIHKQMVFESKIPEILNKYNYDINKVLSFDSFKLLENKIPNVCADRLDYSLKLMKNWESKENLSLIVSSLEVTDQGIIFNNQKAVGLFAKGYLKCQTACWGLPLHVIAYQVFSQLLNQAIVKGIITWDDFNETDKFIMDKIYACQDENFKEQIQILLGKKILKFSSKEKEIILRPKFRYVDPLFIKNGEFVRLSDADSDFRNMLKLAVGKDSEGIKIGEYEGHLVPIFKY